MAFIEETIVFIKKTVTFIKGTVIFIGKGAVISVKGAVIFVGGAVISVNKGSSAIKRLFETVRVGVGNIKGVNKYNLRWWLIIYKLNGLLLLIYSLISLFNYFVGLFL